jgi:hypothetical protein
MQNRRNWEALDWNMVSLFFMKILYYVPLEFLVAWLEVLVFCIGHAFMVAGWWYYYGFRKSIGTELYQLQPSRDQKKNMENIIEKPKLIDNHKHMRLFRDRHIVDISMALKFFLHLWTSSAQTQCDIDLKEHYMILLFIVITWVNAICAC